MSLPSGRISPTKPIVTKVVFGATNCDNERWGIFGRGMREPVSMAQKKGKESLAITPTLISSPPAPTEFPTARSGSRPAGPTDGTAGGRPSGAGSGSPVPLSGSPGNRAAT